MMKKILVLLAALAVSPATAAVPAWCSGPGDCFTDTVSYKIEPREIVKQSCAGLTCIDIPVIVWSTVPWPQRLRVYCLMVGGGQSGVHSAGDVLMRLPALGVARGLIRMTPAKVNPGSMLSCGLAGLRPELYEEAVK